METAIKKNGHMLSQLGRPVIGVLSTYSETLRNQIKAFRKKNAGWGPISILVELVEVYNYDPSELPSNTSVYNYLKQEGFIEEKEPAHPLPLRSSPTARYCHHKWEMDAKGRRKVIGLGYQSLINIKDVFSRLYCMCLPISVKPTSQPAVVQYKWALRMAFTEFGMPKIIQVDKDNLFTDNGTKSPFPKKLHLWLIALGIELCFIDRPPPAQNNIIERSHRTFYNQAMKGKVYKTWKDFFDFLQQRRKRLNENYPSRSLGGKAPLQRYPQAKHSGRPYCIEQEAKLLDINRIYAFLAKGKWYRLVGKSSRKVHIGGIGYYVSKIPKNRNVVVSFCKKTKHLLFHDVNEQLLAKHPIRGVSIEDLMGGIPKKIIAKYKRIFKAKDFPL